MGKRKVYSEALRKSSLNSESLSYPQNGDNHSVHLTELNMYLQAFEKLECAKEKDDDSVKFFFFKENT